MNHFIEINQLTYEQVEHLLANAFSYKKGRAFPNFSRVKMANLFYEPSTRTRMSFELAGRNLGISVMNLDVAYSSENKGEAISDTLANLAAMGINLFVIRHKKEGTQKAIAQHLNEKIHIINAGDGTHSHPSQALLDLMTILEHKSDLSKLKVAIVGNIRHSRVANSLQSLFALMGVGELNLVAPKIWQPSLPSFGKLTDSLSEGIEQADIIICLRVQNERLLAEERIDIEQYKQYFSLTKAKLALAKPDVIVMHPGPVNRGIEIDSDIVDGPHSVILQQVSNGVFMRMAIIESLLT